MVAFASPSLGIGTLVGVAPLNLSIMSTSNFCWRNAALVGLLIALHAPAFSKIQGAELNADGSNQSPELFLVMFDQTTAKMSYTLNLGIDAASFWVAAQQDNGASLFRTLDPATDAALNGFLGAANLANTRWMIAGGTFDGRAEAEFTYYTTQTNNGVLADQQTFYDRTHGVMSPDFTGGLAAMGTYVRNMNNAKDGVDIIRSTIGTTDRGGSALASKDAGNTKTYAASGTGFKGLATGSDGSCVVQSFFCAANPLGVSSWFYKITPALSDGAVDFAPIMVDEFDNLTADGYWGLIKDPASSKYILSYTLNGANPRVLVSTDDGRARLSSTDYNAESGNARLITVLGDNVANHFSTGAVTAVPEPQSWALMGLGLVSLFGLSRNRRKA